MGSCDRLQQALLECHRRNPQVSARTVCSHLNRAFGECIVAEACPEEFEAVRSLCGSGGTHLKRQQCQESQFSLSLCLSRHQEQFQEQQKSR